MCGAASPVGLDLTKQVLNEENGIATRPFETEDAVLGGLPFDVSEEAKIDYFTEGDTIDAGYVFISRAQLKELVFGISVSEEDGEVVDTIAIVNPNGVARSTRVLLFDADQRTMSGVVELEPYNSVDSALIPRATL